MGFPFDGSSLPAQRAGNLVSVPGAANPLQYVDAALVNRVLTVLAELGVNFQQAPWLGFEEGSPDLAGTDKARVAYIGGRLRWSREGEPWEVVGPLITRRVLNAEDLTDAGDELVIELFQLPPGMRVKGIRATVNTAFTGVAGPITCRVGYWPDDSPPATALGDLLVPFSLTTQATFGDETDSLGVGLAPEFVEPGGYYPDDVDPVDGWHFFLSVVSESGNPLNFSAGQLVVHVVTEGADL